jgi:hypothetical protein
LPPRRLLRDRQPGALIATVATVGVCAAIVTLMLALASLSTPARRPGTVGKRYQVTAQLPWWMIDSVRPLPGVAEAEGPPVDAADTWLGEPLGPSRPGTTRASSAAAGRGRRCAARRGRGSAGLADASACGRDRRRRRSWLAAVRCASASGIVRGLENDGRIVGAARLAAGRRPRPRLEHRDPADARCRRALDARLRELGAPAAQRVAGATTRNGAFLGVPPPCCAASAWRSGRACTRSSGPR